ncbi:glycosyl hydrolase family 18 protein [Kiloniella sp. EL199]|uniref:glycosyl hydrolase family 18 protein n=1 Tax=Kiloniella sp. EL199 TaxID=2107581 RepID=UPI002110112B|nr:glycosyl hydrolase family 18 protein [Kiloniella sp. EL199]
MGLRNVFLVWFLLQDKRLIFSQNFFDVITSGLVKVLPVKILNIVLLTCFTLWPDFTYSKPRFIIYYNSDASALIDVAQADYTHVILSFLGADIRQDNTIVLMTPPKMADQWGAVKALKARGIKVLISFGGGLAKANDYQKFIGRENELAVEIAGFIRSKKLDGVDLDFEASDMLHKVRKTGVADGKGFLINLTKALRRELPSPAFSISHAPQSPYLNPEWHGGPYLDILKTSGDAIDWITVQYYNNPGQDGPVKTKVVGLKGDAYSTSYRGLVAKDGALAWPSEKIIIGKPVYKADAFSGHISPEDIIKLIIHPLSTEYGDVFGGIAGWQFSTHTEDHRDWNSEIGQALFR